MGDVENMLGELWDNRWAGEVHLQARGSSGGSLIMWDKREWIGELVDAGRQVITCRFTGINQELSWSLSVVYANCNRVIRRELWSALTAVRSICKRNWVVCGDFNVTRFVAERANCHRMSGAMTEFSDNINELELVDPPLFGGSYTWRRGENHKSASRIDRFLYSADREDTFQLVKQCTSQDRVRSQPYSADL